MSAENPRITTRAGCPLDFITTAVALLDKVEAKVKLFHGGPQWQGEVYDGED